jgi:hypothetical protein
VWVRSATGQSKWRDGGARRLQQLEMHPLIAVDPPFDRLFAPTECGKAQVAGTMEDQKRLRVRHAQCARVQPQSQLRHSQGSSKPLVWREQERSGQMSPSQAHRGLGGRQKGVCCVPMCSAYYTNFEGSCAHTQTPRVCVLVLCVQVTRSHTDPGIKTSGWSGRSIVVSSSGPVWRDYTRDSS